MRRRERAKTLGAVAAISVVLLAPTVMLAGAPALADDATATAPGFFNPQDPNAGGIPTGRTATVSPPIVNIGESLIVSGSGWPADSLVTAAVCGNNYLNGSVDCNASGQGQSTATSTGTIAIQVGIPSAPPTPCPCVVHVATLADTNTVDIPFQVNGVPTAPPSRTVTNRSVDVDPRLSGSGPLSAYLGGAAKRELILTVTNTGSDPLVNPVLNLTVGKGEDPTGLLTDANGNGPALGTIQPGQSVEYRQTVTLTAPAFGQYRVKGQFVGLDSLTVNQQRNNAGDLTFSIATSTYPWVLIVLVWLLLQIPLLGLYKRRPTAAPVDEDPLFDDVPVSQGVPAVAPPVPVGAPAPTGAAAPAAAATATAAAVSLSKPPSQTPSQAPLPPPIPAPTTPAPPPPPGYAAVGAAAAAPSAPAAPTPVIDPNASIPAAPPLPPPPPVAGQDTAPVPSAPAPTGVEALRALLQPPAQ
ncbi:MAG TPA: hypothetical protein DHW34_00740 [Actinobacteria bacterium]|nr:hypothetical protein [Actinomycetota bacterium]